MGMLLHHQNRDNTPRPPRPLTEIEKARAEIDAAREEWTKAAESMGEEILALRAQLASTQEQYETLASENDALKARLAKAEEAAAAPAVAPAAAPEPATTAPRSARR